MLKPVLARALVLALLLSLAGPGIAVAGAPAAPIALFGSEPQAQQHCPRDRVVWLNLPTGIYHYKGQKWYARTKHGAFVCKIEADRARYRPSLNG